jgi:hypothetical protein
MQCFENNNAYLNLQCTKLFVCDIATGPVIRGPRALQGGFWTGLDTLYFSTFALF